MIELIYKKGKYKLIHDGINYTFKNLKKHISYNGHEKENVGFAVPKEAYKKCQRIARNIESIFKKKNL